MTERVLKNLPVWRLNGNELTFIEDCLSDETPISLVYNGISHVVLMATASNLAELALGFSLTEGILEDAKQLYDIELVAGALGIEVRMEIASKAFGQLKNKRRQLSGRTGCGLCGIQSLEAVTPVISPILQRNIIPHHHISAALPHFSLQQVLRAKTGSVHAAAWVNKQGVIEHLFEDVGRHNALDKLIGFGAKAAWNWAEGFVLISSRASYEMIVKSAVIGIGCIVALSAPTAFAVQLAKTANLTLIGFAKTHQYVIYTHPEYINNKDIK